jgi:signal transduction histidine kinase
MHDLDIIQLRNPRLVNYTVYLTVAIMAGLALVVMPQASARVAAIALCLTFGLVHALGFRRAVTVRRAAVYFIVQMILVLALIALSYPSDVFNLLFYILGLQAVLTWPNRPAVIWIVIFYLGSSLSALWSRGALGIVNVLFNAAAFLMTAVFGYALRQAEIARRQNQHLLDELRASQEQLRELAVVEERNRLAREMHDSLGHRLTVAIVQLEAAQRLIPNDPGRAGRMIGAMRDEMKEALAELRRTVTALRTPLAGQASLDLDLPRLCQAFQQKTGIATHFSITPGFPALPETYRLAFYRAAQETLTNIQRHAGAGNAWMQLSAVDRQVTLVTADDGKGLDRLSDDQVGSGLLGLQERAAQLGGQLHVAERPGGGAHLTFTVPLPE